MMKLNIIIKFARRPYLYKYFSSFNFKLMSIGVIKCSFLYFKYVDRVIKTNIQKPLWLTLIKVLHKLV